jgi:hypothetical protein
MLKVFAFYRKLFLTSIILNVASVLFQSCGDKENDIIGLTDDSYDYPVGKIFFKSLPVPLDSISIFIGLGELNVFPKDHGGFVLKNEYKLKPSTISVFAVADGKIIGIRKETRPDGDQDFAIRQKVSTTIEVQYAHVDELSDYVLEAAGMLQTGYGIDHTVDIEVKAGQAIALIGQWAAMDFQINDQEVELNLISKSRYPIPTIQCGYYFDYYLDSLKDALLAVTERTIEPRGGKIDYDIPGRIIGNWFLEAEVEPDQFGDWSAHLAFAYGHIHADRIAIANGYNRHFGPPVNEIKWVKGNEPKPETIGLNDGLIKYDLINRFSNNDEPVVEVFLVQMLDSTHIKVETFKDKTMDDVVGFAENARIYVR